MSEELYYIDIKKILSVSLGIKQIVNLFISILHLLYNNIIVNTIHNFIRN